jgi:hypothetical protein
MFSLPEPLKAVRLYELHVPALPHSKPRTRLRRWSIESRTFSNRVNAAILAAKKRFAV